MFKKIFSVITVTVCTVGCSSIPLDQTLRALDSQIHTAVGMEIRQISDPATKRFVADVVLCEITCDTDYSESDPD